MRVRVTAFLVSLALLVPALGVAQSLSPCNLPVLVSACCCAAAEAEGQESRVEPVCCCELREAPKSIDTQSPALLSQSAAGELAPARMIAMPLAPAPPAPAAPMQRLGARAPPVPAGGLSLFAHHHTSLLV